MKTLRHTIAPEEEGRMVKQIARSAMGASHRLFSQVKFAGGEKAIKLFGTQAEAIAYAKKLAVNQEGSISIHKKDGKLRKQKY